MRNLRSATHTGYRGERHEDGCRVYIVYEHNGDRMRRPLPLALGVMRHSPTGFEWGYEGSGPAQLALAILVHFGGSTALFGDDGAIRMHQEFKRRFVGSLPKDEWTLSAESVRAFVLEHNVPPDGI